MIALPAPMPVARPAAPPPPPPPPFDTEATFASEEVQLAVPVTELVLPSLNTASAWKRWLAPTSRLAGFAGVMVSPTSVTTSVTVSTALLDSPW